MYFRHKISFAIFIIESFAITDHKDNIKHYDIKVIESMTMQLIARYLFTDLYIYIYNFLLYVFIIILILLFKFNIILYM